jgi:prepilin-type N-terminal cleavage/methylation domain-containing protein
MLNIRHQCLNKKGFTIIELIYGMAIFSVLLSTVISMLNFSNKVFTIGENEDEFLLNGRFAIEYLKEEIRSADLIIPSNKISNLNSTYPENIGFVMMKDNGISNHKERYRFYTYYLMGDKLVRISRNLENSIYPDASRLSGYNEMCEGVLKMDNTRNDFDNRLIYLSLTMGYNNKEVHTFKSILYIANNFDYE